MKAVPLLDGIGEPILDGIGQQITVEGIQVPTPITYLPLASDLVYGFSLGVAPVDFTRSTVAKYEGADGLITDAAINGSRFNGALYLEGAATQQIDDPTDVGAWGTTSAQIPVTFTTDPEGGNTARRVQANSTGTSSERRITKALNNSMGGTSYALSFYIQPDEVTFCAIQLGSSAGVFFDLTGAGSVGDDIGVGGNNASIEFNATTGFYKCTLAIDAGGAGATFRIYLTGENSKSYAATDQEGFWVWWPQGEEGLVSTTRFEGPTTSTGVRAKDDLSIPAENIPAPTADYSVGITTSPYGVLYAQELWSVTGETGGGRSVSINAAGKVVFTHGGNTVTSTDTLVSGQRIVATKDGSDLKLYLAATVVAGTVTPGSVTGTASAIQVASGTNAYNGLVEDLTIYDVALTQQEVTDELPVTTGTTPTLIGPLTSSLTSSLTSNLTG